MSTVRILEGQSRKWIQGGSYKPASLCPLELLVKGAFVAPSGDVNDYTDAGPTRPSIFLNMVAGTREDVQEAGLAVIGSTAYTLETSVFDEDYRDDGPAVDDPITVEAGTALVPALIRKAVATVGGEYIHGFVKSVEGTGADMLIKISMEATNAGQLKL